MDYFRLIEDSDIRQEYTRLAYQSIITDLFFKNIRGEDRSVDLDFHEMEDSLSSIGAMIPGCFYIFAYKDNEMVPTPNGNMEYHDRVPVLLSCGIGAERNGRKYVAGLNVNLLPIPQRAAVLQTLYNIDKQFFDEELYTLAKRNMGGVSKNILKFLGKDGGDALMDYLSKKYKVRKDTWAWRRYYLDKIDRLRMIDYWQWKYIPFLDYGEGIRGIAIKDLQKQNIS